MADSTNFLREVFLILLSFQCAYMQQIQRETNWIVDKLVSLRYRMGKPQILSKLMYKILEEKPYTKVEETT